MESTSHRVIYKETTVEGQRQEDDWNFWLTNYPLPFFRKCAFCFLVLAVLQNFTGFAGFAPGRARERLYPFYFEFVTRIA